MPAIPARHILRAVGPKRQAQYAGLLPRASEQEVSPTSLFEGKVPFGDVKQVLPGGGTGITSTSEDASKPIIDRGDEEWLATSPLKGLTREQALQTIAKWTATAGEAVARISRDVEAVDKLDVSAAQRISAILASAEDDCRGITWSFRHIRLYLKYSNSCRAVDRIGVWNKARELVRRFEVIVVMAGKSWHDHAKEALFELKLNTNEGGECKTSTTNLHSSRGNAWKKVVQDLDDAMTFIASFNDSMDQDYGIERMGMSEDEVRQAFTEIGTDLDWIWQWCTAEPGASTALFFPNAWLKRWELSAEVAPTPEQIKSARVNMSSSWLQRNDVRRKVNEMENIVSRLAEDSRAQGDYLVSLSRVLKALKAVVAEVPLMWWEKSHELGEVEVGKAADEVVRADGTA